MSILDFSRPNIMLDLETMGTSSNAAIIAIGMVEFDADKVYTHSRSTEFFIDLQSCLDMGMEVDGSTIMWWMHQSDAARAMFKPAVMHIKDALCSLVSRISPEALVWGNGAAFDNVILANAYRKCGMDTPWKHCNDRCYRTMKHLQPRVPCQDYGVAHSALDDAIRQAIHLQQINKHFKQENRV